MAARRGVSHYYLYDGQGSVGGTAPAAGTKTSSYAYDPYGVARVATTNTGAIQDPYRYTAGWTDNATGLTKLGYRYYDPTIGRFTQPDPSGQETNPYTYAGEKPVSATDPSGLHWFIRATLDLLAAETFQFGYVSSEFKPAATHGLIWGVPTAVAGGLVAGPYTAAVTGEGAFLAAYYDSYYTASQ